MSPVIEKLLTGFRLAEGPHWDAKNRCLYFTDMTKSTIHKYVPSTKKHTSVNLGGQNVSIVIPVKGQQNEFVITLDNSIALLNWDGVSSKGVVKKLYEVEVGTNHVFNDGKCDRTGRIWAGTMACKASSLEIEDKQGNLYSFFNGKSKIHRNEIGIANGIAFDYKRNKMYYVDSFRKTLDQYDIDFETGTLSNLKSIFTVEDPAGILDGMTIDSEGNLWVAVFKKASVYNINPNSPNTLIRAIEFPANQITSVSFGGENLDELYVTSANFPSEPAGESPGTLFRVTGLNVRGLPADEAVL